MVTSAQIKEAIRSAAYFYRDCVSEWKIIPDTPDPMTPQDTGMSVVLHNTGPSFYGIYGGSVKRGAWQSAGPGNVGYYPLLICGRPQLLFLNRTEHVKYKAIAEEGFTKDGTNFRNEIVETNFLYPGDENNIIAIYEFRKSIYWGGPYTIPRYEYWVKRIKHYDPQFRGIGWSNYEFVDLPDGGEKCVWVGYTNPNPALASRRPPLAEFPIKLHNSVRLLLEELAQYYQNSDTSLASELSTKASRIANWVNYWKRLGIMRYDFLDLLWPPPNYASLYPKPNMALIFSWLNSRDAFYEVEFWKQYPFTLGLSPYKSHLVTESQRLVYLNMIWPSSPYYKCLYIIDLLHRNAIRPRNALSLVMNSIGWDGKGVNLSYAYPFPTYILDSLGDALLFGRDILPEVLEAYKGDAFGAFLCAMVWIYKYAVEQRDLKTASRAEREATAAADIALNIQIPWTGRQLDPKGHEVYIPNEAGGFMGAYDVAPDGYRMGSWIPLEMTLFERVMTAATISGRRISRKIRVLGKLPIHGWTKPNYPWPGSGSQAFETTLMCIKGLKMYKELVLGDYT